MESNASSGKIGLGTATVIGLNAMIGAGVIAIPSLLATKTGPAGILTFALSMIVAMFLGLSLGSVAAIFPGEGWNYLYPSRWGGHRIGMFSACIYFIGVVIAMGFLVQQCGIYLHHFIPGVSAAVLGVAMLTLLTLLVLAGAEMSSWGQYIIIFFVLAPLFATTVLCGINFNPALLKPFMPYGIDSVFAAAPVALFSFLGFESIASLYGIVQNPTRNVPRACVLAILGVGFLYISFAASVLFSVPASAFTRGVDQTLAEVIATTFPAYNYFSVFVVVSALFAIIGTLHSMIWSLSVLLVGIMKRIRATAIQRAIATEVITPGRVVVFVAMSMLLFALFGRGELLLNMSVLFIVPTYVLSILATLLRPQGWFSWWGVQTIGALAGGFLMLYYASAPLLCELAGFFVR